MIPEERTMIKIALVIAVIGIGILMAISKSPIEEITSIGSITEELLNNNIKIIGTISSLKSMPSLEILKVKDKSGTIDVVAYRSDVLDLNKGDEVEIEGKISRYKETLQVEAKRIHVL